MSLPGPCRDRQKGHIAERIQWLVPQLGATALAVQIDVVSGSHDETRPGLRICRDVAGPSVSLDLQQSLRIIEVLPSEVPGLVSLENTMFLLASLILLFIVAWLFFNALNEKRWVDAHMHDETVAADPGILPDVSEFSANLRQRAEDQNDPLGKVVAKGAELREKARSKLK